MYRFADSYLTDIGMVLPITNLIGGRRLIYCHWRDIQFSLSGNELIVRSFSKPCAKNSMYGNCIDNAVILAQAISLLQDTDAVKMSDLLELAAGTDVTKNLHEISVAYGLGRLPDELDQSELAFTTNAIASSQSGHHVKASSYSIAYIIKNERTVADGRHFG